MTTDGRSGRAPATEGGIARLGEQLVELLGPVSAGVRGPDAEDVAGALAAAGLPSVVGDDASSDVVVALGEGDGSSSDDARSYAALVTARARLAVVFTPRVDDERSTQWWDDLFADVGFDAADVLREPLWEDSSWDAHGLTGLTLYVRASERALLGGPAPSPIPRSALHPGVLGAARRAEISVHQLVDRLDLYDPSVADPVESLRQAFELNARDAASLRRELETVVARSQEELDRVLRDVTELDAARSWEAGARARAEEALGRAGQELALLRREIDELVAASTVDHVTTPSVARQFGRRAASGALRRLQRGGLEAAGRVSTRLPGRAGMYATRAVAIYRSLTIDWLEATRELFDTDYYLVQRPGLIGSGIDPVVHYAQAGWRQRLDPHPLFDTDWYLRRNASLLSAGVSPLEHFVAQGWREGADPHPLFDTDFYVRGDVHVALDGDNPLAHYLREGWREGRNPHPIFETRRYLEDHPEVAASGQCPLVHYVTIGWKLGYQPSEMFDPDWYVEHYPEALSSGVPPYRYFLEIGVRRGDRPSG